MSTIRPWRTVVTPHEDIRQGRFDASVFAANLGHVLAGQGAVDYRDAQTFFSKTYMTGGLSRLLKDMLERLGGKAKTEPVIQLQTPFGGGKTHTLLSMYHMIKSPKESARVDSVKALLDSANLKEVPKASVAALVGTALNVNHDRTLWGEMAFQLGGDRLYQMVAKDDEIKTAPGTNLLGKLLETAGPCVILIDETLTYLLNASAVKVGDESLRGTTLTFLQQLTEAISNCPHAMLVVTLTSQIAEFMGENAERAYASLEKVMGRIETVKTPVEGQEIYEVIRRRLFESLGDEQQRRASVEAYWAMYQKLGDDVPAAVREPGYRDRMLAAYPFHPELISALYERWGSIPEFERTRGVLRLLAFVISQLYRAKDNGYVIQSGDVDLGSVEVRPELIKFIGNQFHGVIDTDIAGKDAKAPEIDRQLGSEYAKESVSEKLAKAIFMYSFGGGAQRGATLPQLRVSVLNPDMPPPFMSDAADRLTKRLWHLYHDSGLFYFDAQANLNRILVDREEMVRSEPDRVRDFCKGVLNNMVGDQAIRVFRYPQEDRDVADQPQLGLVMLDLHQVIAEDEIPEDTGKFIGRIVKHHGHGYRKHANALIFLAPDQQRATDVLDAGRRLLALKNIDEDASTKRKLTDEQKKDLASRLKEAEARLPGALSAAYRHIVVPVANKDLRAIDMGIATLGAEQLLSKKVIETLQANDQLLAKLDPSLLIGPRWQLWPEDQDVLHVPTLAGYFTTLTHLPALMGPDVLLDAVARGVERGLFAYALGDGQSKQFDTIRFREPGVTVENIDSAWLVRPDAAKALLPEPTTAGAATPGTGTTASGGTAAPGAGGPPAAGSGGGVKIVAGERRLDRVRIQMRVPWENWQDIYTEVIDPLAKEGADIICDVNILAKGESAIRENTIELVIRESLSQRGIDADIETG
ncbi:MAG: ATP-binding protein [Sedimentisphaerales bacterium]|nr:ATP-binding protein [Sedimentisphaerales bacterium]